jgi:FkbM family methyltransferase
MEFYSQCKEDDILYNKYIKHINIENGVYLEMGAMNGIDYSNTLFFEKYLGWTGILIEPHVYNFNNLVKNRPNNKLYNNLVSNINVPLKYINYKNTFCLSGVSGIVDTMPLQNKLTYFEDDNPWQNNLREKDLEIKIIEPVTLSYIIKDSGLKKIDFFSLDVEGHEYNVLLSWDWSIPINIFLIENNNDIANINKLLNDHDYIFIEMVGPNSLYFHKNFKNML